MLLAVFPMGHVCVFELNFVRDGVRDGVVIVSIIGAGVYISYCQEKTLRRIIPFLFIRGHVTPQSMCISARQSNSTNNNKRSQAAAAVSPFSSRSLKANDKINQKAPCQITDIIAGGSRVYQAYLMQRLSVAMLSEFLPTSGGVGR